MPEHPISIDKAKDLLAGDLSDVHRKILVNCCAPIYWFKLDTGDFSILHNGTLTIVQTPKKILGVTAAHVFRQYEIDLKNGPLRLQLMDEVVDDLRERLIDVSDALDIAIFELDEGLVKRLGKTPLGAWPPMPPQEGKATLLDLLSRRHDFFAQRVDGIFRALSGEHVTNSPAALGQCTTISMNHPPESVNIFEP